MSEIKRLLEVRKKRKTAFRRQDWDRWKKIDERWRKPRGRHSKMRQQIGSRGALVKPGYRSPNEIRGLSRDGKEIVYVNNMNEISKVDPKTQAAIIGASVGGRKKIEMLKEAVKKNMTIYNIKNANDRIKKAEETLEKRKKEKKSKKESKAVKETKKVKEKKADKEEKKEEEVTEEEKQRREAEKLIIQK